MIQKQLLAALLTFLLAACGGIDYNNSAAPLPNNGDNRDDNNGGDNGNNTPKSLLVGDLEANGGRNYAAVYCEGKDNDESLPLDPRELITGSNLGNPNYAVWYNDAFEVCQTPALFENQRRQNELLVAQGKEPIYSAKPRPETCGEWRDAVEAGRQYIMSNGITGEVITRQSLYNLASYLGFDLDTDAEEANRLIKLVSRERYGWPSHPYPNPFPLPGEDPNQSDGGSLQLPIALVQTKDDDGKWTGNISVTCFACHIGQMGEGEVLGNSAKRDGHPELYGGSESGLFVSINGSNTDTGLALYDIERSSGKVGDDAFGTSLNTPGYMANRTRGTNAADQEIVNILMMRDLDSLDWRGDMPMAETITRLIPSAPASGGDQDMPTWWWTHNKTRYLWVGFGSAGSSRGNFFPASTNPNDGHWSKAREGDFQDLDIWLNAIEAPEWPYGFCSGENGAVADEDSPHCINLPLAEQGAVLFHAKDLWADGNNANIPAPPVGNGSCATCHGVYSPHYAKQDGFLPDPSLVGMSGATVPLDIIGTDPAQSDLFTLGDSYFGGVSDASLDLSTTWFAYPDASPDYVLPEEKTPIEEGLDDVFLSDWPHNKAEGTCKLQAKGGYVAQPLHGVWASGPYLHNGSVPDVWGILKPEDRPDVWRRQLVAESDAAPVTGDRGFDTNMQRAYNHSTLGWNYETLECTERADASSISCYSEETIPTFADMADDPAKILADYFAPPYVDAPNQGETMQRAIYNTNAYSKGNQGHEFTSVLSDSERKAILEYLKTL